MPTNVPGHKVILEGHIGSGEIFATGFWCFTTATTTAAALAANIVTALGTNGTSTSSMLSRLATVIGTADGYDRVRVYNYLPGSLVAQSSAVAAVTGGAGQSTRSGAYQDALVCTLRTAQSGRSHRGRMYIPYGAGTDSTGQATTSLVDKVATAIGDLFGYVKNTIGGGVVVYSQTLDAQSAVTQVDCNSKIDTQRRRAGKQSASYTKSYTGL